MLPLSTETFENRPSQPLAPLCGSACLLCPGAGWPPLSGHQLLLPLQHQRTPREQESSGHPPQLLLSQVPQGLPAPPSRWAAAELMPSSGPLTWPRKTNRLEPPLPSTVASGQCSWSPEGHFLGFSSLLFKARLVQNSHDQRPGHFPQDAQLMRWPLPGGDEGARLPMRPRRSVPGGLPTADLHTSFSLKQRIQAGLLPGTARRGGPTFTEF